MDDDGTVYVDANQTIRSLAAFLYLTLASGNMAVEKLEAIIAAVEDMNLDTQEELITDFNLLMYCRQSASRIIVPLCDHRGPHDMEREWGRGALVLD